MALIVLKPGLLDTVQDNGRYGYSSWGINPGGVMDDYAAGIANALVGNDTGAALLELHFPGPQLLFEQAALLALCGADFTPKSVNSSIPMWQPFFMPKNGVLFFEKPIWGARTYLAIQGGLRIDPWLNSYSTNLKAGAGGFQGRKLAKMDRLATQILPDKYQNLLNTGDEVKKLNWKINPRYSFLDELVLPVLEGHEWPQLDLASKKSFSEQAFTIGQRSDRMGYRMGGPSLYRAQQAEMISAGVTSGTVQLLPDGQLIILMADHQTTGGYPRVAHLHYRAMQTLSQLKPGTSIRFRITSRDAAEQDYLERKQEMALIKKSCIENLEKWQQTK